MQTLKSEVLPRRSSSEDEQQWVVVALDGVLDPTAAPTLNILEAAVADNPGAQILVDLSNVIFLHSFALDVIARVRARATAAGGTVTLLGASEFAGSLLRTRGLEEPTVQPPKKPNAQRGV